MHTFPEDELRRVCCSGYTNLFEFEPSAVSVCAVQCMYGVGCDMCIIIPLSFVCVPDGSFLIGSMSHSPRHCKAQGYYSDSGYVGTAIVDLDLANYEHFLDVTLTRDNNMTTGKIYQGGRHHQLLESLTQVLRDFRSYFSVKMKSPYQCTQNYYSLSVVSRLSDLWVDNCCSIEASCAAHPTADVLINFASYRRSVIIL
ncbi:unnamed protein product [Malus baccata var. baccata]